MKSVKLPYYVGYKYYWASLIRLDIEFVYFYMLSLNSIVNVVKLSCMCLNSVDRKYLPTC